MLQLNLLLQRLNHDLTRKFRKWESTNRKIINATRANVFNTNCIREHLCPKYISFVQSNLGSNDVKKDPFKRQTTEPLKKSTYSEMQELLKV